MTKAHEDVVAAALAMPAEARVELAERLLNSVDVPDQADVDMSWGAEVERRIDELDRGEVTLIPGKTIIGELRKRAQ